jgi:hypothetical protein
MICWVFLLSDFELFLSTVYISLIYSVEITYGINSVISKLMTFAENAETIFVFNNAYFKLLHLFMTSSIFDL